MGYYEKHVLICTNQKAAGKQCCANTGGEPFFDHMKSRLLELEMHGPGKIRVSKSGCLGRCSSGPCIVIYPEGVWYTYSSFADIDEIIEKHLVAGRIVEQLLIDQE
ncbi:(2Fe-2S) ferredoxin domain-containing protein [Fluoribacter dumoffii]|uniref:2FeCpFd n=1 Tax=Fluoribacter dumoffii TaxID=463 RepID=A0A377G632_9GAMM|nr:(2Fe-2S) ferredoxin domain-containing protein [Fluoribacter dumoffii]KTC92534.1 (2Fe-2S) ferredoxin [Fluoribacter dumoffii NY 23]MCW8387110.1 (2Fe-2S) ferredoxin domain-containing protein [Fluoribacter dumoffii]MCW8417386.1 (2Fe-2S) ferredoxin domain-containing protein [Fluoribacter dumoffii]MCW8454773.1 (2Fe-2S) ferredoxin domain-containing protein [Fluoribacter dumoffii]MCW8461150.1 (2Fe-2S) ferredoxin domain-containing protein [Fluoribacter dumoffii]